MSLGTLPPPPDWRDKAACLGKDPEMFFPLPGGDPYPAKAVCASCTVAEQCLAFAMIHDQRWGIWGGLTEDERTRLRRRGRRSRYEAGV